MVKTVSRSLAACLFCVVWGVHVNASEMVNSEAAEAYLQPQSQWPPKHSDAAEDVAPVPLPVKLDDYLVQLGKVLFHDKGLSGDSSVSCASCHQADIHFADHSKLSPGVQGRLGKRTTPMLRLVGLWEILFWDARIDTLEALIEQPLTDPLEMDNTVEAAVTYITSQAKYVEAFTIAYGDDAITWPRAAQAIAEFMRSIPSPERPFDLFMQAVKMEDFTQAEDVLSKQEREGLHLFRTKAGCVQCHSGALFSDQRLHNTGLTYYGRRFEDLGHFNISGKPEDVGKFRTPSLRYLSERNHFMHNGLFDDLLGIVRMYAHGGSRPKPRGEQVNDPLFPKTTDLLQPFDLSKEEEQALLAFLRTL
ncbi:cytochrome c peroxidase [Alkalimonas sp. NCh-2]|uniref:cytochrome-c peroxidase n=1 Tax=Alkalimonas sp. NCh-2 TaxID=3144846 RepID=UPI0031F71196